MMNPIRRVATPQSCPGVWNEPSAGLLSAELLCEAASQPASLTGKESQMIREAAKLTFTVTGMERKYFFIFI